ncbi:MAG: GNAT family N-acetyltransferase [Longimicrobiales bacterium]|nr:GNAT family N-acetyltransferase [Longimicrobiales bacterium]
MAPRGRSESDRGATVLGRDDVDDVVGVLCASFFDYPVMRFVLGSRDSYDERLERLVRFFVMARILRREVILGIRRADGLTAAALVSHPGAGPSPPELGRLREDTWAELGGDSRSRYEAFGAAVAPLIPRRPHLHLNMIGVRPVAQGAGLGRVLLETVHRHSASHAVSTGVTLTTEVEANVALYRRFGYEVVGSAGVRGAFTTWAMYRPDDGGAHDGGPDDGGGDHGGPDDGGPDDRGPHDGGGVGPSVGSGDRGGIARVDA